MAARITSSAAALQRPGLARVRTGSKSFGCRLLQKECGCRPTPEALRPSSDLRKAPPADSCIAANGALDLYIRDYLEAAFGSGLWPKQREVNRHIRDE
jgi:hypothetical protein